jgi:hypothetical protein
MTVGSLKTQLKYGELKSLALKDDLDAIVAYINLGLIDLYGRFKIARGEQLLNEVDGQSIYPLNTDCMIVEAVYDEAGEEIAVNDDGNALAVFTPSYNTIQVPNAATGTQISILYVQNPVELDPTDVDILTTEVPLPVQLITPLLHYVGYRAHGSLDGDIKAENNTHLMRYEASVKRIKDLGLFRSDVVPANVSTKEQVDE